MPDIPTISDEEWVAKVEAELAGTPRTARRPGAVYIPNVERDQITAWMRKQAFNCEALADAAIDQDVKRSETEKAHWYVRTAHCIDCGAHWPLDPAEEAEDLKKAYTATCLDCGETGRIFGCIVEALETYDVILCDDCFDARNEEYPHPNSQFGAGA